MPNRSSPLVSLKVRGVARARGFTLIELIMVVVMLGVLAVFAAPRILDTGAFNARGFHDETLSLLRYAQKTAIAQRRTVCVALNDTGVALTMDTATVPDGACDAALPMANVPRGGTGLSGSVAAFEYAALGNTNQTGNVTVTIVAGKPITVDAATGFVHD
jgi:MSHA pilin protein MshC